MGGTPKLPRSARCWWQWSRGVTGDSVLLALLPRAPHPCSRRDAPSAGSGFWTALAGLSPGSSRLWLEELITAVVLSSAKLSLSPGWQTASAVWSPTVGPSPLEHPCRDGAEERQNPQPRSTQCWDFAGCLGDSLGVSCSSSSCAPQNGAEGGSGLVFTVIQQSGAAPSSAGIPGSRIFPG